MLIKSLQLFFLVNLFLRVFIDGEVFAPNIQNELTRVGSGALGPAVSYGGYLAILITLSLLKLAKEKKVFDYFLIILLFIELLGTYTRGGLILLPLLILIPFFIKREVPKKNSIMTVFFFILIITFFNTAFFGVFSARSSSSSLVEDSSFLIRLELIVNFFAKYQTKLFGNGVGNPTYIKTGTATLPIHNTFIEILDQTGFLTFLIVIILVGYVLYKLYKIKFERKELYFYRSFLLVSLLQWLIFANTTATSILYYYPYEATMIFWILLFSPFLLKKIDLNKSRNLVESTN